MAPASFEICKNKLTIRILNFAVHAIRADDYWWVGSTFSGFGIDSLGLALAIDGSG
jgi:hypothetical protein